MRPKTTDAKLVKIYETLGLSLETLKAKRKEWRSKFKKLKRCKPVIQTICSEILPWESCEVDTKKRHLTSKQAKKLGLDAVTARYNELVAVCSMQNDAFQHMFELVSFTTQFAALYEEQDSKRKSEMNKMHKDVKAAMDSIKSSSEQSNKTRQNGATPKRKPANKQIMKDFLRSCDDDNDDDDDEEDENSMSYTLNLFS